jgi:hydroxymethylglutaryl-CoA reductase (NADPH)
MKVPAFLLQRLYVKGSLSNTSGGWGFTLHNSIASGEASALDPLSLDGEVLPPDRCSFLHEGRPVPFSAVAGGRTFGLRSGEDITISVDGDPLAPGPHTIEMGFTIPVIGHLSFEFTDEI